MLTLLSWSESAPIHGSDLWRGVQSSVSTSLTSLPVAAAAVLEGFSDWADVSSSGAAYAIHKHNSHYSRVSDTLSAGYSAAYAIHKHNSHYSRVSDTLSAGYSAAYAIHKHNSHYSHVSDTRSAALYHKHKHTQHGHCYGLWNSDIMYTCWGRSAKSKLYAMHCWSGCGLFIGQTIVKCTEESFLQSLIAGVGVVSL